ncbi:unnamed protein product [Notodromas monacha]|uniref:Uncharacterized protein n=1 Tax=Notodromas monacha TaxID=399045 RepID=A0A7R9C2H4_9CRUS|nr:unnamed protein product [Notodromas monacha]CAG0924573.1 unnamed protein product [Notodromas monacha]
MKPKLVQFLIMRPFPKKKNLLHSSTRH